MAVVLSLSGTWFKPDWAAAAVCHCHLTHTVAVALYFVLLKWMKGVYVVYRRQKVL